MTERLYRPPDWEDVKPKFSEEFYIGCIFDAEPGPLGVYKAVYDKGVEAGADAAIKALLDAIETTVGPIAKLLDKYGSPEPTWAEVGQAFQVIMRIIKGLW